MNAQIILSGVGGQGILFATKILAEAARRAGLRFVVNAGAMTGTTIVVDGGLGLAWPWAWYLRDLPNVSYPSGDTVAAAATPDAPIRTRATRSRPALSA